MRSAGACSGQLSSDRLREPDQRPSTLRRSAAPMGWEARTASARTRAAWERSKRCRRIPHLPGGDIRHDRYRESRDRDGAGRGAEHHQGDGDRDEDGSRRYFRGQQAPRPVAVEVTLPAELQQALVRSRFVRVEQHQFSTGIDRTEKGRHPRFQGSMNTSSMRGLPLTPVSRTDACAVPPMRRDDRRDGEDDGGGTRQIRRPLPPPEP